MSGFGTRRAPPAAPAWRGDVGHRRRKPSRRGCLADFPGRRLPGASRPRATYRHADTPSRASENAQPLPRSLAAPRRPAQVLPSSYPERSMECRSFCRVSCVEWRPLGACRRAKDRDASGTASFAKPRDQSDLESGRRVPLKDIIPAARHNAVHHELPCPHGSPSRSSPGLRMHALAVAARPGPNPRDP